MSEQKKPKDAEEILSEFQQSQESQKPAEEPKLESPEPEPELEAPEPEPELQAPEPEPELEAPKEEPKTESAPEEPKIPTESEEEAHERALIVYQIYLGFREFHKTTGYKESEIRKLQEAIAADRHADDAADRQKKVTMSARIAIRCRPSPALRRAR